MGLELERRDNAEVAASAPKSPEEILVLRRMLAVSTLAVGGDDLTRQEIVDGHAVFANQPTDTASQRETADTGLRDDPAGDGETEGVRFTIEIAKRGAALDADGACRGIDMDGAHAATGR